MRAAPQLASAGALIGSWLLAVVFSTSACEDIRAYEGTWEGEVAHDPELSLGFASGTRVRAQIGLVTRTALELTISLPEFEHPVRFEMIRGTTADALGDLRLAGNPLRTALGYLRPAAAAPPTDSAPEPFLAVVSFFPEDRIDLRLIRGPSERYGLFRMARRPR